MTSEEKNTERQNKKVLPKKRGRKKSDINADINKSSKSSKEDIEFDEIQKMILSMDKPSLNITMKNIKFSVDADEEIYSKDEVKHIQSIVDGMSKEIHIDKTYVNFEGNRWKDAFIVEDKWYELVKLIVGSNFGKTKYDKYSKSEADEIISSSMMALSITYMYGVLDNLGYDVESIELTPLKCKFFSEYEYDDRTDWRF